MEGNSNMRSRIEAKYPALLFKQHLTACVEKIYGMIRDNLKKDIGPFLNLCIQVSTFTRKQLYGLKTVKQFLTKSLNAITGTKICKDQSAERVV